LFCASPVYIRKIYLSQFEKLCLVWWSIWNSYSHFK